MCDVQMTGMVAVPTGSVTPFDIGRVLEAALPMASLDEGCRYLTLACEFSLDNGHRFDFPPIGYVSKRLEAKVQWMAQVLIFSSSEPQSGAGA